jgi:hypothetical protein
VQRIVRKDMLQTIQLWNVKAATQNVKSAVDQLPQIKFAQDASQVFTCLKEFVSAHVQADMRPILIPFVCLSHR